MTQRKLLLPAAILSLAVALSINLISSKNNDESDKPDSPAENASTNTSTNSLDPQETELETRREREDPSAAIARRNLEKEFDEILPAQFPNQNSSLCDATLSPGDTLFLGGFKKPDDSYEFTTMTVEPIGTDAQPLKTEGTAPQYKVSMKILNMSAEKSTQIGLDSLVSTAKTRIQKSITFPPDELPQTDVDTKLLSMPTLIMKPGVPASLSVGSEEQAHAISLIVNPNDEDQSIRIRTRVESPPAD